MTFFVLWNPELGYLTASGGYTTKILRAKKFSTQTEMRSALDKCEDKEEIYIKRLRKNDGRRE